MRIFSHQQTRGPLLAAGRSHTDHEFRKPLFNGGPGGGQPQTTTVDHRPPRPRYHRSASDHPPAQMMAGTVGVAGPTDRILLTSDSSNTTEKNFADSERDDADDNAAAPYGYEELSRLSRQVPAHYGRLPQHQSPSKSTSAEMRILEDEDEDDDDDDDDVNYTMPEAKHAHSYTSLLGGHVDSSIPTPALTRKTKFHPDMYLPSMSPAGYSGGDTSSLSRPHSRNSGVFASASASPLHRSFTAGDDPYDVTDQLVMSSLSDLEEEVNKALLGGGGGTGGNRGAPFKHRGERRGGKSGGDDDDKRGTNV